MLTSGKAEPAVSIDVLKAHLRLENDAEDALLAGWLRAATEVVENETGMLLLERAVVETVAVGNGSVRVTCRLLRTVEAVDVQGDDGAWLPVADGWTVDPCEGVVRLPDVTVGDLVTIDGRGPWCIRERDIRGLAVHCRAERVADPAVRPASIGDPGRGNGAPMVPAGPTDIRLIEAPVPLTGEQPALFVWLGGGAGWRGAAAYLLEAGNETPLGEVRDASARGQLVAPLTAGQDLFWDREGALLVAVEAGLPGFETRTEQDVLAGANLLLVGEELLQFRDAWMVGDGIVRLSCLLRGRFGTGAHAGWHEPGKTVRQVVPERLLRLAISADDVGRERVILAVGRGDPAGGTEASGTITGVALGPMAPVHLRVVRRADGAIEGDWMTRAAAMWPWSYPEGRALLWRWKFAETAGQTVGGTLTAASLRLSVAEQVALRGAPFGPGLLMVEVAGEGPAASRTAQAYLN